MFAVTFFGGVVTSCCDDDDDVKPDNGGYSGNYSNQISVTSGANVIDSFSVTLKGYANGADGMVGFCYSSTNTMPTLENADSVVETSYVNFDKSYEITVSGLNANTTYYYRAFATKDNRKYLATDVKTFKTIVLTAVDLGLSVKWANMNVGASSPEEYGDYFAWGETEPYYSEGNSQDNPCLSWKVDKTGYNWTSYKWCNGSSSSMTKYGISSSYGTVDNKTTLDLADDAAHINLGGDWRMPTKAEQDALRDSCTWTWTTQNGVNGYKVTSMNNGNSIFLPAAGYRNGRSLYRASSYGFYWSSSLCTSGSNCAYDLGFNSDDVGWYGSGRNDGHSVRAVCQ